MAARPDHPTSEIDRLSRIIQDRPLFGETKLVAIDGRGGAGKSSLAKLLKARMQNSKVVSVDDFPCSPEEHPFHPSGTQTEISFSRLINEVLTPLKEGREARFRKRSWWSTNLDKLHEEQQIVPGGLVFIEGCFSLRYELRDYYDLRIWIECNLKEALQRSISRDGEEIRYHYDETMILLNCVKSQGDDTSKVRDSISSTNDYHGLSGHLSFNSGQAVTNRIYSIEKVSS